MNYNAEMRHTIMNVITRLLYRCVDTAINMKNEHIQYH